MALRNSAERWGALAKGFHWILAILIIGMLGFGIYMTDFVTDMVQKYNYVQTHKSFGFVVFALAAARLLWRLLNPVSPGMPDNLKPWERMAAHITHYGLYVLMFVMPLSGWLMSSASPFNDEGAYPFQIKNMVFGLFEMPDVFPVGDKGLSETFGAIHSISSKLLLLFLVLHIAASLKHHIVLKDNVLLRMLPFARLRNKG